LASRDELPPRHDRRSKGKPMTYVPNKIALEAAESAHQKHWDSYPVLRDGGASTKNRPRKAMKYAITAYMASLAELEAKQLPPGFVAVPEEITEKMRYAIWFSQGQSTGGPDEISHMLAEKYCSDPKQRDVDVAAYRAMIDAAKETK
jgi:hypothetical protein